jgi:UPF0271 protein
MPSLGAVALRDLVLWQVAALDGLCRGAGTEVRYIKPHGALYHAVMEGGEQGCAVFEAAQLLGLPLLLMPESPLGGYGEAFAERAYVVFSPLFVFSSVFARLRISLPQKDSSPPSQLRHLLNHHPLPSYHRYDGVLLRPRGLPGAVIHDPAEAAAQAVQLADNPNIHTVCIHGDSPNAVEVAKAVREGLEAGGFSLAPFAPLPSTALSQPQAEALARAKAEEEAVEATRAVLKASVVPVVVGGYRPGEGVDEERYAIRTSLERH